MGSNQIYVSFLWRFEHRVFQSVELNENDKETINGGKRVYWLKDEIKEGVNWSSNFLH